MTTRPRLTPAIADVRLAVRSRIVDLMTPVVEIERQGKTRFKHDPETAVLVLVALSGGADSLALAVATAFEARRLFDVSAGAVIVDHGLQEGSADVAARAAEQARALGLDPVIVRRVQVAGGGGGGGGPEAAARQARYAALADAASETGATAVFLGHTLDDQAETVLLGLARGSGAASLSGMAVVTARPALPTLPALEPALGAAAPGAAALGAEAPGAAPAIDVVSAIEAAPDPNSPSLFPFVANVPRRDGTIATNGNICGADASASAGGGPGAGVVYVRPLLGIRRETTLQFCADSGLTPWHDPQNSDAAFARVRVRETVLPVLERELGPGIAEALARTAELAREDSAALDFFAQEQAEELADHAEAGLSLSVAGLAINPAALRQRIIRLAVAAEFGVSLSRTHTLEVARLVTDWSGQGPLHLPGIRVVRQGGLIVFSAAESGARPHG